MVDERYLTCTRRMKEQVHLAAGPTACTSCTTPHCCESLVSVTRLEVEAILQVYRPVIEQRLPALRAQAEVETRVGAPIRYWKEVLPCALLDEGRCLIYDQRPIGCATLLAPPYWEPDDCAAREGPVDRIDTHQARMALASIDSQETARFRIRPEMIMGLASGILYVLGELPDAIVINEKTVFTDPRIRAVLDDEIEDAQLRKEVPR